MKTPYSIVLSIIYFIRGLLLANVAYISEYFNLYSKQDEPNELNQFQIEQKLSGIKKLIKESVTLKDKKEIEKSFSTIQHTIHQLYVEKAEIDNELIQAQTRVKQLTKEINLLKKQNITDCAQLKQLQEQLDENKIMKNNNNRLLKKNKELNELMNDINTKISKKVLNDACAHLLDVFIEETKMKFEELNIINDQYFSFISSYNSFKLNQIKKDFLPDESSKRINNVLEEFATKTNLSRDDLINLLLEKMDRNRNAHRYINNYIDDVLSGHRRVNDFIKHIEKTNGISLIINNTEEDRLMKLIRFNISHLQDKKQMRVCIRAFLDASESTDLGENGPLRISISNRDKEMKAIVNATVNSGRCTAGDVCIIMPTAIRVKITHIYFEDNKTRACVYGQSVRLKLTDVKQEEILPGFVLCNAQQDPCRIGRKFDAQVGIIEHKSIICSGYSSVLRVHEAVAKVQCKQILELIDYQTGERTQENPRYIKRGQVAVARFELLRNEKPICIEPFAHFRRLGRFTLHDDGQTVAIGNILKIIA